MDCFSRHQERLPSTIFLIGKKKQARTINLIKEEEVQYIYFYFIFHICYTALHPRNSELCKWFLSLFLSTQRPCKVDQADPKSLMVEQKFEPGFSMFMANLTFYGRCCSFCQHSEKSFCRLTGGPGHCTVAMCFTSCLQQSCTTIGLHPELQVSSRDQIKNPQGDQIKNSEAENKLRA